MEFCRDTKSYEVKNERLSRIREERHLREKVMRQQEEDYNLALALDKVKELEKYEDIVSQFFDCTHNFIRAESGGAAGSSETGGAVVHAEPEKGIEVKQHIQTCSGRRLFSFRYEGVGEPSVGDLRKALKRQRYFGFFVCV